MAADKPRIRPRCPALASPVRWLDAKLRLVDELDADLVDCVDGGLPWIRPDNLRDAIAIGLAWLVVTLAFEFGFGRARGKPWAELLADYDVLKGRIWVLVLVTTAVAPYLAARARGLLSPP